MTEHNQASIHTGALPAPRAEHRASEELTRAQKDDGFGWAFFFLGLGVVELGWLFLLAYALYRLIR